MNVSIRVFQQAESFHSSQLTVSFPLAETSRVPRPSASVNISFKTLDKATAFSRRVTLSHDGGNYFSLSKQRKQHPCLTDMKTNTDRVFPPLKVTVSLSAEPLRVHRWRVYLVRISRLSVIDLEHTERCDRLNAATL